jgi:hypothetical protein
MQIRPGKIRVQFENVLNEVVDLVVLKLENLEKMAGDAQKVEGDDRFTAGRGRRIYVSGP